ncbi:hypothetical protein AB833_31420 [Chromatiales bacterium (ex Bugula neritina AB1)]|nr:hypothetical protein AB833_31420 [Chromatiales bacterium (ex Bugula neritina AB1)]
MSNWDGELGNIEGSKTLLLQQKLAVSNAPYYRGRMLILYLPDMIVRAQIISQGTSISVFQYLFREKVIE